jgi:hypothetical protein
MAPNGQISVHRLVHNPDQGAYLEHGVVKLVKKTLWHMHTAMAFEPTVIVRILSGDPIPEHWNTLTILIMLARVRDAPVKCLAGVELMRIAHEPGISVKYLPHTRCPRLWINAWVGVGDLLAFFGWEGFSKDTGRQSIAGTVARYSGVNFGGAQPGRIVVTFNYISSKRVVELYQDTFLLGTRHNRRS